MRVARRRAGATSSYSRTDYRLRWAARRDLGLSGLVPYMFVRTPTAARARCGALGDRRRLARQRLCGRLRPDPLPYGIYVRVAFEGEKAIWAKSFLSTNDALEAAGL